MNKYNIDVNAVLKELLTDNQGRLIGYRQFIRNTRIKEKDTYSNLIKVLEQYYKRNGQCLLD